MTLSGPKDGVMTKPNLRGAEMSMASLANRELASSQAERERVPHSRAGKWMGTLLAPMFLVFIGAGVARAQTQITDNWTHGTGFWNNAANWDNGVPNNGGGNYYDVVIKGTGLDTITFDASPTVVDTLTLGSGETLQDDGSARALTIGDATSPFANSGTLVNNGTIDWGHGGTLTVGAGAAAAQITNNQTSRSILQTDQRLK